MRPIYLAAFAIAALCAGFTQVGAHLAVPATLSSAAELQTRSEPIEPQMRQAFEGFLKRLVGNVMVHVAETGGQKAVRKVRQSGNDQFAIRTFRKLDCHPRAAGANDYVCDFAVEVAVATGTIRRTMHGDFIRNANNLVIADLK